MPNRVDDEELARALHAFVIAVDPVLRALRQQGFWGGSNSRIALADGDRSLRDRAFAVLGSIDVPGSSSWEAMDVEARSDWWLKRVGTLTAALAAAPSLGGVFADKTGLQAALGAAGQGIVLCAIAHEYGLEGERDRIRLLASVLFSRNLPLVEVERESRDLLTEVVNDLEEARRQTGLIAIGRAIWRLGHPLSAVRKELANLPRTRPTRRLLRAVPVLRPVGSFLNEREALRAVAGAGRAWIAEQNRTAGTNTDPGAGTEWF